MRYNIKGRWQPGHQWDGSRFTFSLLRSCPYSEYVKNYRNGYGSDTDSIIIDIRAPLVDMATAGSRCSAVSQVREARFQCATYDIVT